MTAVHEVPAEFVRAQLDAVFSDIGVDAAKTGMLFSAGVIEAVAEFLAAHPVPLVVDPVLLASSGARLLRDDAVATLVGRLFPLATVVTPNLPEAEALTGSDGHAARARGAAGRRSARGPRSSPAVTATSRSTTSSTARGTSRSRFRGTTRRATHGAGCTHSATLAAALARGLDLEAAAREAARVAAEAVAHGLVGIGAGDGPVDVFGLDAAR